MVASALEAIFKALAVSRILYAVSAWGGFLNASDVGRLNSVLAKAKNYGYCSSKIVFESILSAADLKLFTKVQNENHCLYHLLPYMRRSLTSLRERGHPYVLPQCSFTMFKNSFVTRMLFAKNMTYLNILLL